MRLTCCSFYSIRFTQQPSGTGHQFCVLYPSE
uniref:Uncharacterized protein n=1 Tax=Arundo donax TaxID=35708 RepID=A0A0A9FMQ1_ARUDO